MKLFRYAVCILLPVFTCQGSVSDPPEIQIKENTKVGTTTDPAVRVLAQHTCISSMPDDQQFVQFELIIEASKVVDETKLFVIDPTNDLIAETPLRATRKGDNFHYIFRLKKPFTKMSTIHILFKGGLTKRLLLGTTSLPKSGEQAAPSDDDKPSN